MDSRSKQEKVRELREAAAEAKRRADELATNTNYNAQVHYEDGGASTSQDGARRAGLTPGYIKQDQVKEENEASQGSDDYQNSGGSEEDYGEEEEEEEEEEASGSAEEEAPNAKYAYMKSRPKQVNQEIQAHHDIEFPQRSSTVLFI